MTVSKQYRILVVEDSEEIRDLLRFVFEVKGHLIEVANDGLNALSMPLNEFDAIILDLQMPNMDGKQFLHSLRKEMSLQTPVVMFTTHERDGLKDELIKAGANRLIFKPARAERLLEEVLNTIEGH